MLYTIKDPLKLHETSENLRDTYWAVNEDKREVDIDGQLFVSKEIAVELLEALKLALDNMQFPKGTTSEFAEPMVSLMRKAITNAEK